MPARPNKYRNKKVEYDGHKFDSKKEARRYQELKLLERAGEVKGLELQKRFPFVVEDKRICVYVADFYYLEQGGGEVVEDVKSPVTRKDPVYRIKNKLFEAIYGYKITEV
ncbi:DUF1064 domain-containing protein [Kiloniella litopenaei]|uniref:DUF1064 domain-containing protein n=1 Tax=Kiloniella litopenaei TaxID=1549748 RepID=UPI003BABDBC8